VSAWACSRCLFVIWFFCLSLSLSQHTHAYGRRIHTNNRIVPGAYPVSGSLVVCYHICWECVSGFILTALHSANVFPPRYRESTLCLQRARTVLFNRGKTSSSHGQVQKSIFWSFYQAPISCVRRNTARLSALWLRSPAVLKEVILGQALLSAVLVGAPSSILSLVPGRQLNLLYKFSRKKVKKNWSLPNLNFGCSPPRAEPGKVWCPFFFFFFFLWHWGLNSQPHTC
jgi:hypothetical protein